MAAHQQQQKAEAGAAPAKCCPAAAVIHPDKENIDPFSGQQQGAAAGPAGPFNLPPSKQFGLGGGGSATGKKRTPLADITALCMLQTGLPPQGAQQSAAGGSLQKGLWGALPASDKAAGAGSSAGPRQRLSSMR